jgi:N-acetylmuramoyl-L-alanine amidase
MEADMNTHTTDTRDAVEAKPLTHQEVGHLEWIKAVRSWEEAMAADAATRKKAPRSFRKRAKQLVDAEQRKLERLRAKRMAHAADVQEKRDKRKTEKRERATERVIRDLGHGGHQQGRAAQSGSSSAARALCAARGAADPAARC